MKVNYLSELKKIIKLGQMDENDPYYYLYEYIKTTQRDLKILLTIDDVIIKNLASKREYLEKELEKNLRGRAVNYDLIPEVGEIIKKIVSNQIIEYETLRIIEGTKKNRFCTQPSIKTYRRIRKKSI